MFQQAKFYDEVGISSDVLSASPHRLIQLLYKHCLEKMTLAKLHIQEKNIQQKIDAIHKAADIITALRTFLNYQQAPELSNNLDALYEFIDEQILYANMNNDPNYLDTAIKTLKPIAEGWDELSAQLNE